MRLRDVPKGTQVKRNNAVPYNDGLYIEVRADNTYWYINPSGQKPAQLRKDSTSFDRTDFVIIGHIKTSRGANKMRKEAYKNTKVITLSDTGDLKSHDTEDDALEHIADVLEGNPRTKHKMFKPYQAVEPKRPNLVDMIKEIVS